MYEESPLTSVAFMGMIVMSVFVPPIVSTFFQFFQPNTKKGLFCYRNHHHYHQQQHNDYRRRPHIVSRRFKIRLCRGFSTLKTIEDLLYPCL
jgi:hypothetical protein